MKEGDIITIELRVVKSDGHCDECFFWLECFKYGNKLDEPCKGKDIIFKKVNE